MPPLILITRPLDGALSFAKDLRTELGSDIDICISPLLQIESCDNLPDLAPFKTVIFTSSHAVSSFCKSTPRRDFICYTVGETTGQNARLQGFDPIIGPGSGNELAEQILRDAPASPCLYLRGDHVAFDIAKRLNKPGLRTQSATVYKQSALSLSSDAEAHLRSRRTIITPVFSQRSAALLLDVIPMDRSLYVAAISKAVAKVFPPERVARLRIADAPEKASMVDCVATLWRDANQLEGNSTAQ